MLFRSIRFSIPMIISGKKTNASNHIMFKIFATTKPFKAYAIENAGTRNPFCHFSLSSNLLNAHPLHPTFKTVIKRIPNVIHFPGVKSRTKLNGLNK